MAESQLTAKQAQAFVEQLVEQYGYGAYPEVKVTDEDYGTWLVTWRGMSDHVTPMTAEQWQNWLRAKVGSITPERLETSEG